MHPVNELSSELLRQFTQVDYANHVALVAEVFVDGCEVATIPDLSGVSAAATPAISGP
jgi:hypothetical protein